MGTRGKKKSLLMAVVWVVGVILALHPAMGSAAGKTEKERKKPPVDLKVPAKVETATFALG